MCPALVVCGKGRCEDSLRLRLGLLTFQACIASILPCQPCTACTAACPAQYNKRPLGQRVLKLLQEDRPDWWPSGGGWSWSKMVNAGCDLASWLVSGDVAARGLAVTAAAGCKLELQRHRSTYVFSHLTCTYLHVPVHYMPSLQLTFRLAASPAWGAGRRLRRCSGGAGG